MVTRMSPQTTRWMRVASSQPLEIVVLVLIVVGGAALRFHDLGRESYSFDEAMMVEVIGTDIERVSLNFDSRPPIFVWAAKGWTSLFGTSEAAARSLSAVAGTAAIVMMYAAGRELFGVWVGLMSAFLLSVSQVQIEHAQEFRYYAVVMFLTTSSFFFYLRTRRMFGWINFVGWLVSSFLLLFTHYLTVFALGAQTLHSLIMWRRTRSILLPWLGAQAILYASPVIALVRILTHPRAGSVAGGESFNWLSAPSTPLDMIVTLREYLFPEIRIRYLVGLLLIGGLAVVGARTLSWRTNRLSRLGESLRETATLFRQLLRSREELSLLVLWVSLPNVMLYLLSFVMEPMYVNRYTIAASAAFYVLTACVMWGMRRLVPTTPAVCLLLIVIVPGLRTYYEEPLNEEWREAAAYVQEQSSNGDAIMLPWSRLEVPWALYYRGNLRRCSPGEDFLEEGTLGRALERCLTENDRVWIVLRTEGTGSDLGSTLATRSNANERPFNELRVFLIGSPDAAGAERIQPITDAARSGYSAAARDKASSRVVQ